MIKTLLTPYMAWIKVGALVVIAAVLFGSGWAVNGWRLGTQVADLKAQHAQAIASSESAARKDLQDMTDARDALADRLSAIDKEKFAALEKERHENATLRDRIAAGAVGLRIGATCPATPEQKTGAAASGPVGTGGTARLDATAERAYLALRDGITTVQKQLSACQGSLRQFTGQAQ